MATIEERIKALQAKQAKKAALEAAKKNLDDAKAALKKARGK